MYLKKPKLGVNPPSFNDEHNSIRRAPPFTACSIDSKLSTNRKYSFGGVQNLYIFYNHSFLTLIIIIITHRSFIHFFIAQFVCCVIVKFSSSII